MKYFRLTIDAQIDDDLYQEMLDQGYTRPLIKAEVKRLWNIGQVPKPCFDAQVTDIKFMEDDYEPIS